jgi:hypothetical protein
MLRAVSGFDEAAPNMRWRWPILANRALAHMVFAPKA